MKWLSVKEHTPPEKKAVFILCSGKWIGTAYFDRGWHATLAPYEFEKVTHFCIPDAVEIEEE